MRIGQLWIVDASTADPAHSGVKSRHLTGMRLSDGLAAAMEAERAKQFGIAHRNNVASGVNAKDFGLPDQPIFKQAPGDTMETSVLPRFSLASIDQAALAGSIPTALASFFAAFSTTATKNLTLEAIGVEIAELPLDTFSAKVAQACDDPTSVFGNITNRNRLHAVGYKAMKTWWQRRQAETGSEKIAKYDPRLFLIRRVFYARGINFVYHDTNATAVAFRAAFNAQLPAGVTPPAAPTPPTATTPTLTDPTGAIATGAAATAALKSVMADVAAMKTALAGANIGIGASFGRATARGIEITELFENPLAFGYDALVSELSKPDATGHISDDKGIGDLCNFAKSSVIENP
jgi:hypothetical protein